MLLTRHTADSTISLVTRVCLLMSLACGVAACDNHSTFDVEVIHHMGKVTHLYTSAMRLVAKAAQQAPPCLADLRAMSSLL